MPAPRVVTAPAPLLDWLFAAWPETKRNQVRGWLKLGCVAVNGRSITQFDHPLRSGDSVAILPRGAAPSKVPLPGGLRLRHEDDAILVVEKPAGMLSVATGRRPERTAYALLTDHVRRGDRQSRARIWIVHRLDRETSGLMVFARTEAAKRALQQGWEKVEKNYFAVIEGRMTAKSGVLESFLDESDDFKVRICPEAAGGRRARTSYRVAKEGRDTSLVEFTLDTGRRHQIRVQLAAAGCPIVGDGRYGAQTDPARRVALHASSLRFPHPVTGELLTFDSPLPGDLGALVLARKQANPILPNS